MKKILTINYQINKEDINCNGDLTNAYDEIKGILDDWIKNKGGIGILQGKNCTFNPKYGGSGKYNFLEFKDKNKSIECLSFSLIETNKKKTHKIETIIDIMKNDNKIDIYNEIRFGILKINKRIINIKVPLCIKRIFEKYKCNYRNDYYNKHIKIITKHNFEEFDNYLLSKRRELPIICISSPNPNIIEEDGLEFLKNNLNIIGNVYILDKSASYVLTNKYGKKLSCYNYAARIYYKGFSKDANPYTHDLIFYKDFIELTNIIKKILYEYYSLTNTRNENLKKYLQQSSEDEEWIKYLEMEIERLEEDIKNLKEENWSMKNKIIYLTDMLNDMKKNSLLSVNDDKVLTETKPPDRGEIRYYKKTHSAKNYDFMVQIKDCGHNAWIPAKKADKAKKGIARLENRDNWQSIQKCGRCTGGGVYKVKW